MNRILTYEPKYTCRVCTKIVLYSSWQSFYNSPSSEYIMYHNIITPIQVVEYVSMYIATPVGTFLYYQSHIVYCLQYNLNACAVFIFPLGANSSSDSTWMYWSIRRYVSYVSMCAEVSTGMYRNVRWYVDYARKGAKVHGCAWFVVWFSVRKYNM